MNGSGEVACARVATISFTTHSRHLNYGAVLHGWAFQQVLKRMGCESVIIDYIPMSLTHYHLKWPVLNTLRSWRHPFVMGRRLVQWLVSTRANLRKYAKFEKFKGKRLVCTPKTYTEESLVAASGLEGCDPAVFVCESDVIWKVSATHGLDRGFFLDFPAAKGRHKVAYAPSVGCKPLSLDEERRFSEYVRGFDAVSSRERAGAEWIARLANREVPWLLDPTLLLPRAAYAAIAKESARHGYVLLYTCMNANTGMIREARRLADSLGKPLVEVGNYGINRWLFGHEVIDDAGVEEWLGLFMGADAIVCNSFHGICFSLVFHKPFFAFRRKENDWRFDNICEVFGVEDRLIAQNGRIPENVRQIDFTRIDHVLEAHVARAKAFIEENIVRPVEEVRHG